MIDRVLVVVFMVISAYLFIENRELHEDNTELYNLVDEAIYYLKGCVKDEDIQTKRT